MRDCEPRKVAAVRSSGAISEDAFLLRDSRYNVKKNPRDLFSRRRRHAAGASAGYLICLRLVQKKMAAHESAGRNSKLSGILGWRAGLPARRARKTFAASPSAKFDAETVVAGAQEGLRGAACRRQER